MPECSTANIFPVRPIPVWISSTMSRMPCRSATSRSRRRKSGGGTTKPPSPRIGSTTIAATRSACTSVMNRCSRPRIAHSVGSGALVRYGSGYGARYTSGMNGPKLRL